VGGVTAPATAYGAAMLDLVDRLSALAERYELELEEHGRWAFCELASTPHLWPLDDVWLEVLLTWAGFELDDPDDLHQALGVVRTLLGADPDEALLFCGHGDEPSHLCAIFDELDLDDVEENAAACRSDGTFDPLFEVRQLRLTRFGDDPRGRPDDS
jgi:hypothetical protein